MARTQLSQPCASELRLTVDCPILCDCPSATFVRTGLLSRPGLGTQLPSNCVRVMSAVAHRTPVPTLLRASRATFSASVASLDSTRAPHARVPFPNVRPGALRARPSRQFAKKQNTKTRKSRVKRTRGSAQPDPHNVNFRFHPSVKQMPMLICYVFHFSSALPAPE